MSLRSEISLATRPVLAHSADAVQATGLLFVAGILPVDAAGALVGEGDVSEQARYVFAELDQVLAAGGCAATDVARIHVYLTSIEDHALLNEPLRSTFSSARPAATVVEVGALAVAGARIEVDAIAERPS